MKRLRPAGAGETVGGDPGGRGRGRALAGGLTPTAGGMASLCLAPLTAWRLAHQIPGARFVVFEESGHLPSYEEPAKYKAVLEAFLDGR